MQTEQNKPNIQFPEPLIRLARLFSGAGARLYAVGGIVRNQLLGYPVSDMDICSRMLPEDVLALCENNGIKTLPTGAAYGTVTIHADGCAFEHTTFRSDVYPEGGGHRPSCVRFSDNLEEDAVRRDFTVNAIYADILSGELIDPTGGIQDCAAGIIRATSKDPSVIMRDDALRMLRMVRFAAELGFAVEENTKVAAKAYVEGLRDISPERVRDELSKILCADMRYMTPRPNEESSIVLSALLLLEEIRALDIILPELARGRGVRQRADYHKHDVLLHAIHTCACMQAVKSPPDALTLRLAALLHDVGKPAVLADTGRMYGHDKRGAEIAEKVLRRLRYPNAVVDTVCKLIANHMYDLDGRAKESTLRTRFVEWGEAHTRLLCLLREADVHGSGVIAPGEREETAARWRDVLSRMKAEGAPFTESELACTGADIMAWTGLPAGKRVGEIKRALLLHCARKPRDNTPERLRALARDMA